MSSVRRISILLTLALLATLAYPATDGLAALTPEAFEECHIYPGVTRKQ